MRTFISDEKLLEIKRGFEPICTLHKEEYILMLDRLGDGLRPYFRNILD